MHVQVWVLPTFGDRKPFSYTKAPDSQEWNASFSPDGRWVAYVSPEAGRPELFVAPFPWTGTKWQVSNGGAAQPHWRGDGKEIYYWNFSGIAATEVNGTGSTFDIGNSKQLFIVPMRGAIAREFTSSRDGQKFLVITHNGAVAQTLTLVQNWQGQLRK